MDLVELQKILSTQKAAPVHLWEPDTSGEMDLTIKADGSWHYMGSPINRKALVKLFSTVLRLDEDGEYYLVTPVEKLRISVDDAPFVIVEVDQLVANDEPQLVFRTNVDELVVASAEHAIRVDINDADATPRPYVHVRSGLYGLISRNVFYRLVDLAEQRETDNGVELLVQSQGQRFVLGTV